MNQAAVPELKKESVVAVCTSCSSIQLGPEQWQTLEAFLRERFGLTVQRGVCPECLQRFYPDLSKRSGNGG
jgi:hypothetical protein